MYYKISGFGKVSEIVQNWWCGDHRTNRKHNSPAYIVRVRWNMRQWCNLPQSWSLDNNKDGKGGGQNPLWVVHYHQHVNTEMLAEKRKRTRNWQAYMKSFKRLFSATVINSLVTHRKNIGQEAVHLNFRTDVVKAFLCSTPCTIRLPWEWPGTNQTNKKPFSKNSPPPHPHIKLK
jgi:hypothetical protein